MKSEDYSKNPSGMAERVRAQIEKHLGTRLKRDYGENPYVEVRVWEIAFLIKQALTDAEAERKEGKCCILDVDSPSYPNETEEYWQCRCRSCVKHLIDAAAEGDHAANTVPPKPFQDPAIAGWFERITDEAGYRFPYDDKRLLTLAQKAFSFGQQFHKPVIEARGPLPPDHTTQPCSECGAIAKERKEWKP